MGMTITGGCLCGAVRYECTGEPGPANYCHCADCRRWTGSAFIVSMRTEKANFRIVAGEPKGFAKAADSGNLVTRYSCPDCGSPVYVAPERYPQGVFIAAGSLDDPSVVKPRHQSWAGSRVGWAEIDPGITTFEKGRS